MKKIITTTLSVVIMLFLGCKKADNQEQETTSQNTNIDKLLSKDVQGQLQKMDFKIYTDNNPPIVNGTYVVDKLRLDDFVKLYDGPKYNIGQIANGFQLIINDQNKGSIRFKLEGRYEGSEVSSPFITGSNGNFTIFKKVVMVGGEAALFSYPYAILITGTLETNSIKNLKMAIVGLKLDTPNAGNRTVEGEITVWSDHDKISSP